MKKLAVFVAVMVMVVAATVPSSGAARKVLVEMQTSTTCAPCYAADVFYFQNWLPFYGGSSMIATLAYHVWWPTPGNDPMYLANPTPVQTRINYYSGGGSTYAPRAYIDGFIDGGSGYSTWPGAIEGRFLDPSPITITITGTRSGTTLNLNAAIYAEQAVFSANWRVHWALVESGISAPQHIGGGQYVPFVHDFAHRNMYPDANGSTIAIAQGQTVNILRQITLNAGWVPNNCRVIVFVQNNTDKKVQQVEFVEVSSLTSVGEPVNGVPTTFAISQNYPNPFNPRTAVDYAVSQQSFVSIKVYNLLGQEVRTLVSEEKALGVYKAEWDGRDNVGREVPSGMYMYKMIAGSFSETRKMLLLK
ncbi:MAG: Omp28-related outer membrane protein [Bacteroidota bacterium]